MPKRRTREQIAGLRKDIDAAIDGLPARDPLETKVLLARAGIPPTLERVRLFGGLKTVLTALGRKGRHH